MVYYKRKYYLNIIDGKTVSYITPVPGGVAPMTVTMLIKNTLKNYKNLHNY